MPRPLTLTGTCWPHASQREECRPFCTSTLLTRHCALRPPLRLLLLDGACEPAALSLFARRCLFLFAVRSALSLVSLSALSHVSALGMAWTQGWHGHRDGMDTGMAWTQDTGHARPVHTTPCIWAGPDVRRRHAARCSSLRRAPCASRSPSETASSPSKSPRCSSRSSGCRASIAAAAA